MSFVKPSKIHLIRRGDKPRPAYGEVSERLTHGVFEVQWYDGQDRPLDSELVVTGDFDYARKTKPRKVNPMSASKRPTDPYVFVEGRDPSGKYFGANYRRSQLPALYDALRAMGIHRVTLDEQEEVDLSKRNPRKRSKVSNRKKNPRTKPENRRSKSVKLVQSALNSGVILHFSTNYGTGTAGPYHTAVPTSQKFAIFRDYHRAGFPRSDYYPTAFSAADHLVEFIGVGAAIDALKSAARKRGTFYTNLDTPIRWV